MNLINIIKSTLNAHKPIEMETLPSQGLFYKDNLKISIKKAAPEDIEEYESNYDIEDVGSIIYNLKKIVRKNTILNDEYTFGDIKSIDIIFIFLEIVKFTNGKPIVMSYINDYNIKENIEFNSKNFNYFKIDEELMNKYKIEGYPTIKLLKDSQVVEYDAKPTKSTMEQFLHTVL